MLETEIKKLTAAIERLSELLVAGQSITITDDGTPVEPQHQSPANEKTTELATKTKTVSVDEPHPFNYVAMREEAKDLCLTLVRDNRDNKKLIGAYLVGYAAKTIAQLADENLEAFIASMREIQNAK